ncbi:hypothetical protein OPT61_g3832 [Boeremia exigua]|uniref:Uncharacterized protein n=1 Tax=Boeremia exigua TaxID=749465 RepID=A0ACC2IGL5_9PLEO|nr:hypothetical protein OPT61_g3832 [Boeremia exigua]
MASAPVNCTAINFDGLVRELLYAQTGFDNETNSGEAEGVLVRGPCAVSSWDTAVCANVCLYDERISGGLFPRVRTCSDGSYCCDNDSACCAQKRGVFLDGFGRIASSTTSESSSTSSTPTSSEISSTTTTVNPSTTDASATDPPTGTPINTSPSSESGLSQGAKAGLGVGISVGVLAIVAVACLLWRRRRRAKSPSAKNTSELPSQEQYIPYSALPPQPTKETYQHHDTHELMNETMHELPSSQTHELDAGANAPRRDRA